MAWLLERCQKLIFKEVKLAYLQLVLEQTANAENPFFTPSIVIDRIKASDCYDRKRLLEARARGELKVGKLYGCVGS